MCFVFLFAFRLLVGVKSSGGLLFLRLSCFLFFFSLVNTQLRSRAIVIVMHFFFLFVFLLSTDEK